MRIFNENRRNFSLFNYLRTLRLGNNHSIRDNAQLVRLLAQPSMLDEKEAQAHKQELASRITGFDIDLECEKEFATNGVVISPLTEQFKTELAEKAGDFAKKW